MSRQLDDVTAALTEAAGRTARLMRAGLDPAVPVPGLTWTAGQTAAHLVADLREHTALVSGMHGPAGMASLPGGGPDAAGRGAAANQAQLDGFTERDPVVLAGLLEEAVAKFAAAVAGAPADEAIVTANGVAMTPVTLTAICLGEQLIHGLDLARAAGRPWPVERADALQVIPGILAVAPDYLDTDAAAGVRASYELRFGPRDRYRFTVEDAKLSTGPADRAPGRPDCVIAADPAAFLLVGYGRAGQWSQILRGRLRAGGRRPWLALRFSSLLISP